VNKQISRELHHDQEDEGSNPTGANFVLQFLEKLDIIADHRTPNVAQCTLWMVYLGQIKIPNEIIVRQPQSSKISTCQQGRGLWKANIAQKTLYNS
jgi:hypothetical protein